LTALGWIGFPIVAASALVIAAVAALLFPRTKGTPGQRSWLERHLERRARDLYGLHVTTVVAADAVPAG